MSTTYTPSATATQAPAAAPDPDNFPLLTLPSAGDGDTAASVAQAFKVLGDYIAWMKAPIAKVSAWAQRLRPYFTARGHRRFEISHMGFPDGNILRWDERWDRTVAGTFGADLGWIVPVLVPAVVPVIVGAGVLLPITGALFRLLVLTPDTASATLAYVRRSTGLCVPVANMAVSISFTVSLTAVGANRTTFFAGLVNSGGLPDDLPAGAAFGAAFVKRESDTNWQVTSDNVAYTDTGVAPVVGSFRRLRIDIYGTGTSDDSTARILFFIDDVQVANLAHAIVPTNGNELVVMVGGRTSTTGGAAVSGYFGPIRYRQNMFQSV